MMRQFTFTFFCLVVSTSFLTGQTLIRGVVYDNKGETLVGANIYLEGTFCGTSSEVDGSFIFETEEYGVRNLITKFIGYESAIIPLEIGEDTLVISIELKESINKIDGVTIIAGAFEAGGEHNRTILRELDIASTAGVTADIAGALNTLPGTQTVGEEGKLYVRGGDDYETKTFIDGMRVVRPYYTTIPYTPTRNRFSPFMFKGTSFSTGGYSAEYGQGLSSALILSTKEKADQTRTDLTIIPFGGEIAQSFAGNRASLAGKVGYFNMKPYYAVIPQNMDWVKPPESVDANLVLRQKTGNDGIIKAYGNFMWSTSILNTYDIDDPEKKTVMDLNNVYGYLNTSYKNVLGKKWTYMLGASYSSSKDHYSFAVDKVLDDTKGGQVKAAFSGVLNKNIDLNTGVDFFQRDHSLSYMNSAEDAPYAFGFNERILASFIEADIYFSNQFLARVGLRSEYTWLNQSHVLDPRISLAYKTSAYSDLSFAFGQFHQTTSDELLNVAPQVDNEKSQHYILNYQYINNGRTFRIEGYYKKYHNLVKYNQIQMYDPSVYRNTGRGYARGIDIFWRDTYGSIKNADYWVSYSFLDTKRDYKDFPGMAIPIFASKHNISLVYKHFFPMLKSFLSGTFTYASPRPYDDPNSDGFNTGRTKYYSDLSATIAYMATHNIGVFFMCTNLFGRDNVFGYEFSNELNGAGLYNYRPITAPAKRMLLVGVTITMSKNGVMNQFKTL